MADNYRFMSADSHLDISPDQWRHRAPAKWRDALRVVRLETGHDAIIVGDADPVPLGNMGRVNTPHDQMHLQVMTFESGGGSWTPERRLQEQDEDGVDAEVLFSTTSSPGGMLKGTPAYAPMVHAYNEYLAEEYCATAPDRLIAMGLILNTGIEDAMAELQYCAGAGLKGVMLDAFPSGKGYPTQEDDQFWAAALDLGMPITSHTQFRGTGGPDFDYPKMGADRGGRAEGQTPIFQMTRFVNGHILSAMKMAFGGVFDRFPGLQIFWAETQVGWLPHTLWQMDDHYDRYKTYWKDVWGLELARMPSDYLRGNNVWGMLIDPLGVSTRHAVGVDRLMWGSDFAHAASEWPHSRKAVDAAFAGVPAEERDLMVRGNAIKYFHLAE